MIANLQGSWHLRLSSCLTHKWIIARLMLGKLLASSTQPNLFDLFENVMFSLADA
jgi:hypothetical protein